MIIQLTNNEIAEVPTPETIECNEDVAAVQPSARKWNHGSTQTSDDMYLGGLMCE